MLKSSCIRSMTRFPSKELLWLGDPRFQRKRRLSAADMLDGSCIFTSETEIISNERTDGHTDRLEKTVPQHY